MIILMISMPSLNTTYVVSESRSLGQIEGKSCYHCRSRICCFISSKFGPNVYLKGIRLADDNSLWIEKYRLKEHFFTMHFINIQLIINILLFKDDYLCWSVPQHERGHCLHIAMSQDFLKIIMTSFTHYVPNKT